MHTPSRIRRRRAIPQRARQAGTLSYAEQVFWFLKFIDGAKVYRKLQIGNIISGNPPGP
ncbi:MAG: hypothetical protein ACTSUE_20980 [Promethearchaeota archaeon]